MEERKHKGMNSSPGQMRTIQDSWICAGTTASCLLPQLLLMLHLIPNLSCLNYPTLLSTASDLDHLTPSFHWNIVEVPGSHRFISNWFLALLLVTVGTYFKTWSFLASICPSSISPFIPHGLGLTRFLLAEMMLLFCLSACPCICLALRSQYLRMTSNF